MNDEQQPTERLEPEEDVEAHLLKETVGAGLAAAAIFAGTSQAAPYPAPPPPGTEDVAAELALIPKQSEAARTIQSAKPKATIKAKKAKAKKVVKAKRTDKGAGGGGRYQPQ